MNASVQGGRLGAGQPGLLRRRAEQRVKAFDQSPEAPGQALRCRSPLPLGLWRRRPLVSGECSVFPRIAFRRASILVASLLLPAVVGATEPFEGTFHSRSHLLRLHQVGSRVCGEWSFATQSSNREGLVAGVIVDGALFLNECPDFELACTPEPTDARPQRFTPRGRNLARTSDGGDNEIFVRESSAMPIWNNAQAKETEPFLNSCKW
jgi:hypothetical protein